MVLFGSGNAIVDGLKKRLQTDESSYWNWLALDSSFAVAMSLQVVFIILLSYSDSSSVVVSGALTSAVMFVKLAGSMIGGTLVDRHDRRTLSIIQAIIQVAVWGYVLLSLLTGRRSVIKVALAVVLSALTNGLMGGAPDAMLLQIVGRDRYCRARSLNETRDAAISIAGSPVCAVLFSVALWLPPLICVLLYAISIVFARKLPKHIETLDVRDEEEDFPRISNDSYMDDFKAGLVWLLRNHGSVVMLIAASLFNFSFGIVQYGVQLEVMESGAGPADVGIFDSVVCAASLIGGVFAVFMSGRLAIGHSVLIVFGGLGFYSITIGLAGSSLLLKAFAVFIYTLPFPMASSMIVSQLYAGVPSDMQGRVRAIFIVCGQLLGSASSVVAGILLQMGGQNSITAIVVSVDVVAALIVLEGSRHRSGRT